MDHYLILGKDYSRTKSLTLNQTQVKIHMNLSIHTLRMDNKLTVSTRRYEKL